MSIADVVASKRERLFEVMMATTDRALGTPDADVKQFVAGSINVLDASARGDHTARELYLSSVIPALRSGAIAAFGDHRLRAEGGGCRRMRAGSRARAVGD